MRARAPWAVLALTGCVTVAAPPDAGVAPPFNTCPAHSCASYDQSPAPTCNGGVCLVGSLYSGLVLVVSLPEDSDYAPGQTIAIPYQNLFSPPPTVPCTSTGTPCAQLPGYAIVQGAYTVTPQLQLPPPTGVGWNLGNPGLATSTALPIHVTYRPLWSNAGALVDADSLGLPLDPISASVIVETAPSSPPGPAQGPSIGFQANLYAGQYEVTMQPDPPFDVAYPPDVETVTLVTGTQNDEDGFNPDVTAAEGFPTPEYPSFSEYRLPTGLSGWQTYLRDTTTLRRVSSLATLGTHTNNCASGPCVVLLPTNHHPAGGDALTGTALVIAPPSGVALPTYVATAIVAGDFPYSQQYPTLPAAVAVSGKVTGVVESDGGDAGTMPIEAELYFEIPGGVANTNEFGIYTEGTTGTTLNTTNFEYSAETTAAFDPTSGDATYSITLSPGMYRVTVRPLDSLHQVTPVAAPFEVAPTTGAMAPDFFVDRLRSATGYALVADGRPMAGATVEAIPTACASGSVTVSCLPRDAQTTTAADGTYALAVDPGAYTLRVAPQSGTSFPWVTAPLLVGPVDVTVAGINVPAPVNAGVQLFDPFGNAVIGAVVRMYQLPATGPAVEVGNALTDVTGTYPLLLAPSSQ